MTFPTLSTKTVCTQRVCTFVCCQLRGSHASLRSGLCNSLHSCENVGVGLECHCSPESCSWERESSNSVPASAEQPEHRSSEEKLRLPNFASELERFSREGNVRPARRMRVSISCALCRTSPGRPLMLRTLSLLELRVSVEPRGDETGVCKPGPTTPIKASLVSGNTNGSKCTWHGVEDLAKSPEMQENSSSSSV